MNLGMIPVIALTLGALFVVRRLSAAAKADVQRYQDTTAALDAEQIRRMADECVAAFRETLQVELDLADVDASARALDEAFRTQRPVIALARGAYPLRALELAGAFLAELVRRHGDGEWRMDGGSPRLLVRRDGEEVEVRPFERIFTHVRSHSRAGVLEAWIRPLVASPAARLSGGTAG